MPNPQFSDDEIQRRAYQIYQVRGSTPGDPNADWQEAIRQLEQERSTKGRRSVFSGLRRSLARLEKGAIEPTANWLDKADIFRIFEKVSPIIEAIGIIAGAIIIPVVIWQVGDREQEAKEQQEKAVRAQLAVQNYLNQLSDTMTTGKLRTDEDLQTIVRASTLALLDSPDLQPNPELENWENLRNDRKGQTIGYLSETGLVQVGSPDEQAQNNRQADKQDKPVISLEGANLSGANLSYANLSYANLIGTNLTRSNLISTNLTRSNLIVANLSYANLSGANLSYADLFGANLSYADLSYADLIGTNLIGTNLIGTNLSYADLSDVRGWTEEQFNSAWLCKTKLPPGTKLDSDRDCKKLGIPTN